MALWQVQVQWSVVKDALTTSVYGICSLSSLGGVAPTASQRVW